MKFVTVRVLVHHHTGRHIKTTRRHSSQNHARSIGHGREIQFGARKVHRLGFAHKVTVNDGIAALQTGLQRRKPGGHVGFIGLDLEPTNGVQSQSVDIRQAYLEKHLVVTDTSLRRLNVVHDCSVAHKLNIDAAVFCDVVVDLRIWLKNIRALIRRPSQSPSTCGLDPSPKKRHVPRGRKGGTGIAQGGNAAMINIRLNVLRLLDDDTITSIQCS